MKVVDDPDQLDLTDTVVSIGNFDGVHHGHRQLLGRMSGLAGGEGKPSVVITFFPPSKVVFGNEAFLSSHEEKLVLLEPFAPTAVVVIPFSLDYARTPKTVFLDQLGRLRPSTLIVGEDFRFGHKREGTLNDLSRVTGKLEVFGLERLAGEVVKSSAIRNLLAEGKVEEAAKLLGGPYLVIGEVIRGDGRGRGIGYPTANIEVEARKALPLGVFAVTVETEGGKRAGMANCGARPSYPEGAPALEVHLFDFDGDLYGKRIAVEFHAKIRDQQRFSGAEELKETLQRDEAVARKLFGTDAGGAVARQE